MRSARHILGVLVVSLVMAIPTSTAVADSETVGTYICPLGMEISQTAKFCQTPNGKQIAPVHGHVEVIHGGNAHNSNSSSTSVSISGSTTESRAASRLGEATAKGRCPAGLICYHDRPQERKVRPGETLWGIASYYLGDGQRWIELCTPKRSDPTDLQVGEFVVFC